MGRTSAVHRRLLRTASYARRPVRLAAFSERTFRPLRTVSVAHATTRQNQCRVVGHLVKTERSAQSELETI
eukprot:scaffold5731_cov239-Pinguiococcus_pyrenoidosus.AAC.3